MKTYNIYKLCLALILLFFACEAVTVRAQETTNIFKRSTTFSGFYDTYIETATWGTPDQYLRNNGLNTNLMVDRSGGSSLVKIDLSSIPSNSQISNAKFKIYNQASASVPRRIKLYLMNIDWDEGNQVGGVIDQPGDRGATGDFSFSYYTGEGTNVAWGERGLKGGTDYALTEFGYIDVVGEGWYEADLTAVVQDWARSPSSNYGFFLKDSTGYESSNLDYRSFFSSEYLDESFRPYLEVTYNPEAPLANAGADIEDYSWDGSSAISLDGSASSSGAGEIYSWSILSKAYGSNVADSDIVPNNSDTAISPNFNLDVAGDYTLKLTVTNSLGYSASDEVNLRALKISNHPRIFLTPEKLQFLRNKKDTGTADWIRLKSYADGSGLNSLEEQALIYQVTGDSAYGTRGVTALMNSVASNPVEFYQIALGYDWLYPLLTEQQKTDVISFLKTKVEAKLTDNLAPWHNYNVGNLKRIGMAGLATYGDNPDAKSWMDHARYTRFGNILLEGIKVNGSGGGWPEGSGYEFSSTRMFDYVEAVYTATGERLFDSHSWFKDYLSYSLFSELPQKKEKWGNEYLESPQVGDMERNRESFYSYRRLLAESAVSFFADTSEAKQLQWYLNRTPPVANTMFAWDEFLKFNPNQLEQAPDILSHYASGTGRVFLRSAFEGDDATHIGFYAGDHFTYHQDVAQGSFTIYKYGDLAVKSGTYDSYGDTNSVSHLLAYNSRTISSNSVLICKEEEVFSSYRAGTTAVNDCGQTSAKWDYGVSPSVERWKMDTDYDTADIKIFKDTTDYAYIKSDITKAYNPNKVSNFIRQFVYLRPENGEEFIVVHDRVASTDPSYEKKWLLHFLNEPTVEGNPVQQSLGETDFDGSLVMADEGNGRLFEKSLLPKNKKIKKIGGRIKGSVTSLSANTVTDSSANFTPNSLVGNTLSFTSRYGIFNRHYPIVSNTSTSVTVDTAGASDFNSLGITSGDIFSVGKDYWVNGKNYPATRTDYENDYGEYRIEIISTEPSLEDQFLNVIQPTSTSTSNMTDVSLIEATGSSGSLINGTTPQVVMFSSSNSLLDSLSYQASYAVEKTGEHLILNMNEGLYDVYKDGGKIHSGVESKDEALFFIASGGSDFQVVKVGELPSEFAPVISEASPISTKKTSTPQYIFNSDKAGTITYQGSCSSSDSVAVAGENTITFNSLGVGVYSDCSITVTDSLGNASAPMLVTEFTITYSSDNDLDKDVDIFDYNILLSNFGAQSDCTNQADTNEDCEINIFDYNNLLGDFGKSF